ncbi:MULTISPECIES: hypothetical protein [Brevibacillus]|uniref:Uncharacterized protein n=1 Tax=Brevibacillus laterosporus TaxID=1465 RepID=A0AAP3DJC8_BRELA|nr:MULTISPECIES: hypothetical protein [Brevibacillus]MCG7320239.1 hypothetical protein [Brevibacillus laterosporus]MCR8940402.1 hypothetical protein [Brevibacillus laterosporus]MCR8982013.1 hypothetical protein [Brevibacillus laterosporus]MCZ0809168.1 hypothetical protein [Brevibacillus laterosporus]MCZ0843041.1 hypothetical protein [Brevibacillus laterosporus]
MEFTYTKIYGTEKPYKWFAQRIKELAKEKYGLDVEVTINEEEQEASDE